MLGLPVAAGVIVLVVGILATQLLVWRMVIMPQVRGRNADAEREATIALGGDVLHSGAANFLGLQSRSRAQMRGTGHLAVSREEVVFVLLAPRRTVRIARAGITAVDTPRSHLGKSVLRPLLRIAFTAEDGRADVVAFDVGRSLAVWQEALAAG